MVNIATDVELRNQISMNVNSQYKRQEKWIIGYYKHANNINDQTGSGHLLDGNKPDP